MYIYSKTSKTTFASLVLSKLSQVIKNVWRTHNNPIFSSDAFRLGKHVISNHLVKPAPHIISHLMQFFGVGFTDDDAKKLSRQQYFDKGDFVGYFKKKLRINLSALYSAT